MMTMTTTTPPPLPAVSATRPLASAAQAQPVGAHIFIDNSNIFEGARRAAETREPEAARGAVRLYYRNFFRLIEDGVEPLTRVLGGSGPAGSDDLWSYARQAGYDTDLLHRVEKLDGRIGEQGVDEVLHLKIANALLDHEPPQRLVVCTGDARDSDFGTSFKSQIERALRRGWQVRVWSWRDQLSGRFQNLVERSKGRMTISFLDPYYKEVTFVQAGEQLVDGERVQVKARVVSPLVL
jgi:hypothetical protein